MKRLMEGRLDPSPLPPFPSACGVFRHMPRIAQWEHPVLQNCLPSYSMSWLSEAAQLPLSS